VVLQCVNGYYYRRGLAGNAIRSRRTTIEAIAFARTDDVPAGRPAEVRLAPRHVEVPAGMPVRLTATVLDAAGKRIADAGIKWSATGGKITGEGVSAILAAGKGACVVSAKAGDVTETAPIKVGDRFWADFDTGSLRGWEPIDLGKEPSQWAALWGGNAPPLQSLRQKDPAAASALLWAPAALWTDYDAAADVIYAVGRGALGGGGAVGLAVRASGDGHYRLELDRAGGKARFIRRTAAGEKVLAETDRLPPKADLDPFTNAISRAYHTPEAKKAGKEPLKGWQVDRVRIRCKGDRFTVGVNGKDLFGGPVTDGALTAGAFGPFASGAYYFDNVEVRPAE